MGLNNQQIPSHNDGNQKKKVATGCLSILIILLLIGGLIFAIFAFVDQSHKGNERLHDKSVEEQQKKKEAEKEKRANNV